MNVQDILFYIFAFVSTLYVSHIGLYLVGANLYDTWQVRRRARVSAQFAEYSVGALTAASRTGQGGYSGDVVRTLPLVTIAIPAHNEELVIIRCLESIRRSSYPHIETIV